MHGPVTGEGSWQDAGRRGPRGGVTVRGSGAADAVPDVVVADLGAQATEPDVGSALAAAGDALAAMRDALRSAGVADGAVRTGSTSTWEDSSVPDVRRTVARLGLVVTLSDVTTAGDVLGAVVAAGASHAWLGGLRLVVSDPSQAAAAARTAAFDDATTKATQWAALAGHRLGPVLWVHEDEPGGGGAPRFARAAKDVRAIPVEPGEQTVQAAVQVRFAWADDEVVGA
ncbi:SIMPL domain-containing protein [Cellulomonas sp. HZM]|uniref:SIMPL domain-containing protein n=1 Tax=Cellulomonas sp. HZM TaxID=1454010 RepID=UPI00068F5653|nr:SIMPL domain-containing protein [Cellulomonas sp. HZM]